MVDETKPKVVAVFKTLYKVLRELKVSYWSARAATLLSVEPGSEQRSVRTYVSYCLGGERCSPGLDEKATIVFMMDYRRVGLVVKISGWSVTGADNAMPWVMSLLTVKTGSRVIVAAPTALADRIDAALEEAERAAAVADRFTKHSTAPAYYVVYLAGKSEWTSWYGYRDSEVGASGYAKEAGALCWEIVISADKVDRDELRDVLQHEMGHVATLRNPATFRVGDKWVSEGIAEYVSMVGHPLSSYNRFGDIRAYLRTGKWRASMQKDLDMPFSRVSTVDNSAAYGMSYLAIRRMADRYGEDKMLEFVDWTLRRSTKYEQASDYAFGASWDSVAKDCAKYVRSFG